ncbi:MAG: hypothetical protein WBA46_17145 [Thermomicrobiales bacterium]
MSTFDAAKLMVAFATTGINVVQSDIGQVEGKLKGLQSGFASAGRAMTGFASVPIAGFFTAAFMGAAGLEQAIGKTEAVFGSSAAAMVTWSQNSATSFGLSQSEALATSSTFGSLFKVMGQGDQVSADMSQQLIGLSADMAAFNDVSTSRASQAIMSGLTGEYESLRSMGVFLNENIVSQEAMNIAVADGRSEITDADKVLARYNLIMEQTGQQQGQFAREADGASGSLAIAKAQFKDAANTLGTQLLPIGTQIIQWLASMASFVAGLEPGMARLVMIILAVVAALGPLLIGISMMIPAFGVLAAAIGFLLSPVGLVVAAIVGLGVILVSAYTHIETFRNAINGAASTVAGAIGTLISWFTSFANYIKIVLADGDTMNDWLTHLPGPIQGVVAAIGGFVVGLQAFGNYIKAVLVDGDALNDWLTHLPTPIQGIVLAIGNGIVAIQNFVTAIANWVSSGQAVATVTAIFQAFWSIVQPILMGTIGILTQVGSVLISAFQGFMASNYPGMIADALRGLWNAFQTLWDAVSHGTPIMYALLGVIAVIASPISLTVAALVALGAALTTAYTQSETFRNIVNGAFEAVGAVIQNLILPLFSVILTTAIQQVTNVIQLLAAILRGDVSGAFQALGAIIMTPIEGLLRVLQVVAQAVMQIPVLGDVIRAIIGVFTNFGSTVQGASDAVGSALQAIAGAIMAGLQGAANVAVSAMQAIANAIVAGWNAIVALVVGAMTTVAGAVSAGWSAITGVVSAAVTGIAGAVSAGWNAVTGAVTVAMAAVMAIIAAGWAAVSGVVTGAIALIQGLVSAGWNALVGVISAVTATITGVVQAGWSVLTGVVSSVMAGITAAVTSGWAVAQSIVSSAMALIQSVVSAGWSLVQSIVSSAMSLISGVISSGWSLISGVVSAAVAAIAAIVSATWSGLVATVTGIVSGFVATISSLWNGLLATLTGIVSSILAVVTSTWSSLSATVTGIVSGFVSTLTGLWNTLLSTVTGIVQNILSTVTSTISSMASTAGSTVSSMVSDIIGFFSNLLSDATSTVNSIKDAVVTGFNNAKTEAVSAVTNLASEIKGVLSNLISEAGGLAGSIGSAIIDGITGSLSGGLGKVTDTVKSIPGKAIDTVTGALGIHSPSRVFAEIGAFTIEGFNQGLLETIPQTIGLLNRAMGDLGGFRPSLSPLMDTGAIGYAAAAAAPNVTNHWNVTLDLKSAEELAQATAFFGDMERAADLVLGAKGRKR